jgi:hypothetical protein
MVEQNHSSHGNSEREREIERKAKKREEREARDKTCLSRTHPQ